MAPKQVNAGRHQADAVQAGLRAAGPLTHIVVCRVPHPTGGSKLAVSFVGSDLLLFIIDQMRGQHATATAPGFEFAWHAFGQLKTAVSRFLADHNAGGNVAAAAAPRPAACPARPDLRPGMGASAGSAAPIVPPVRQPPLLPPINFADPFGRETLERLNSLENVEMADAFPAEIAASAAAASSPPPAARAVADDEGEAPEHAGGEFTADKGEEISAAPAGRGRAEHGAGADGPRSSRALVIPCSDLTPVDCDIVWPGNRIKVYAYTGAIEMLQSKVSHTDSARQRCGQL